MSRGEERRGTDVILYNYILARRHFTVRQTAKYKRHENTFFISRSHAGLIRIWLFYGVGSIASPIQVLSSSSESNATLRQPTVINLPMASPGFPSPRTTFLSRPCHAFNCVLSFLNSSSPCPIPPSAETSGCPRAGVSSTEDVRGDCCQDATKSRERPMEEPRGGPAGPWIRLRVRARNQPGAV